MTRNNADHAVTELRVDSLLESSTWLSLNPTLHVGGTLGADLEEDALDAGSTAALEELLIREGYFQLAPLPWGLALDDMARAVVTLTQAGFVAPFCFVYDEFWLMFIKLNGVLRQLLGIDYRMLPHFWAWYIDPGAGQSGWRPHRDSGHKSLFADRRPRSLTVWLPLTDATPLNGCMYVLPAHLDSTYGTPRDDEWKISFQDVRALPAAAGSVLVWTQALLHWGSRSSPQASGPRISMSFEFQRGDAPPMSEPLIPPLSLPSLDLRLRLICRQVLQYQNMQPCGVELLRVANEVVSRVS